MPTLALLLVLPLGFLLMALSSARSETTSVLVVTGGRSVDETSFADLLDSLPFTVDRAEKPEAFALFGSDDIERYAAVLFYDMYQPISEQEKQAFLSLFERGIGVVFLHHSIVSHQEWDEYEMIVGGRYFESAWQDEGRGYGPSTYRHDQEFVVQVVQPDHPVTSGLNDFPIRDETYLNYRVHDFVTPLLRTDYRESGEVLGWTHEYENSRVVYIMLGHDHQAYQHPAFRQILASALSFVQRS
ncbi:MAG: ThuA domain-containing protein [Bacteroidota bacterium]